MSQKRNKMLKVNAVKTTLRILLKLLIARRIRSLNKPEYIQCLKFCHSAGMFLKGTIKVT